ncbi:uncharacterized protein LOC131230692 isoform X2 [Magnolia sinica]|uniref:uncharacterized protein LOC131230692 isoform X2 n=1 Tax=Magnolia sinica TaxID=86752 RepID=UPI00265ACC11|nr:uncharacterized protein LOC131230692 isoform X2 [Magnolia sinica]
MKIKEAKAGALTNFEVLDLLRSRGATSDPLGALGAVSPSECKVFNYLVNSAACNQTREIINEFLKRSEKYNLARAEKLNIINMRPSSEPQIFPIIEDCETRLDTDKLKELVSIVVEVLPPPPPRPGEEDDQQAVEND